MENKRTEELRKYKASVKSKLMAAIAMLMVSSILLSSTTYAWFVLSTAPEVKGMTTTVGSNGSLEIALLNNETGADTTLITSNVGDSTANGDVMKANESWGNIVSLNTGYGLDTITLYPAALNMADTTTFMNRSSLLSIPVYGVDGRVAKLSADSVVAGKLNTDNVFAGDAAAYGVRAVGTAGNVDPNATALANAQTAFDLAVGQAQSNAQKALNGANNNGANASALMKLIIKTKIDEYRDRLPENMQDADVEITPTDKQALGTVVDYLSDAVEFIEVALKAYAAGYEASQGNIVSATSINLDNYQTQLGTYITELNELKADIQTAQSAYETAYGTDGTAGTDDYSDLLDMMMDLNQTEIEASDGTKKPLTDYTEDDIGLLLGKPKVYAAGGLLSDVANFVDSYTSKPFSFATSMAGMSLTDGTVIATPSVDPTHLEDLGNNETTGIHNMTTPSGETGVVAISTTYGYAIDLAFRSSVGTTLLLSDAVQRVSSSEEETTMGSGSNFTLTTDSTDGLDALRIVFVDASNKIVGVAALDETGTDGVYALHMYDWTVAGNTLTLGEKKATDEIITLTADTVTQLTVLVYLDGEAVDSAMTTTSGMINLQFASSTALTPMDYSGYVASVGGNEENP